jgi:tape measure domain-containing protein
MTQVGEVSYVARIDTSRLSGDAKEVEQKVGSAGDASEKAGDRGTKSWSTFAKAGLAAAATAAIAVGVAIIKNIGGAIKRVDTLNNSTRTFENLGFSTSQITSAMKNLDLSIRGLPTSLDEAVRGVTMIASATNDVGKSQKIFSALNNAVLGFGGTTEDVSGAVLQLSQAFSNGRIDAQTWNSLLQNNLGPALAAIARQMGITTGQLKEGLSDGTYSVEQFQDALIGLNEKGGGGMKSLQQIAKDATSGIGTGFENMNTAITRGLAAIITAIGPQGVSTAIATIGKVFEGIFKGIAAVITYATPIVASFFATLKPLFDFIGGNQKVMEVLKLSLIAIAVIIGVLILAAGGALVAALALVVGIIQVTIVVVEKIIEVITFLGDTIAGVIFTIYQFGKAVYDTFANAVNNIKSFFGGLPAFFVGVFNSITGLFKNVGSAIGNAIGSAFQSTINGVLRFAANLINGFIDAINGAINTINKIPGVGIGKLGRLPVPQLAAGGIVSSPTLAMIGEGRESEAVIPLSKLDNMLSNGSSTSGSKVEVTINLSGVMASSRNDLRAVGKNIIESVNEELRAKQLPEIGGGALRSTV